MKKDFSLLRTVVFIILLLSISFLSPAQRKYYGGGRHTSSHGGHYSGGRGTSHKGGHYRNASSYNRYGVHKSYGRRRK